MITLRFSDNPHANEYFSLNETRKILNHPEYDVNNKTVFYCFGYTESFRSESTANVVQAYIDKGDYNIIVLDWADYSKGNYVTEALPNTFKVGDLVGKTLLKMEKQGFNLDNFHVIGHSLGNKKISTKVNLSNKVA